MTFNSQSFFGLFVETVRDRLGDYRANLRTLDGSKKTEVGLLVEIFGNFSDLILFNDGEIVSNRNGLLPLSDGFFERQGILPRSGTRCIFS